MIVSTPSLTCRRALVNNAGYVLGIEHAGDIADADIEGMFATNVLGLISVTQLLIKRIYWKNYVGICKLTVDRIRLQGQESRPCNQPWLRRRS